MSGKKLFSSISLLFAALFLFGAQSVTACSCMATPNLQEAFEDSDQVVIMNVLAVEKAGADDQYFVDGVKSAKMVVEKAYKGTLKVGDEISFALNMKNAIPLYSHKFVKELVSRVQQAKR